MNINVMRLEVAIKEARILAGAEMERLCNENEYLDACIFQSVRDSLAINIQLLESYKTCKEKTGRGIKNDISQYIIEQARRVYPESVSHTGQLTNEQFCEIEKKCDISFYKLGSQDTRYTIRYKGGGNDKK